MAEVYGKRIARFGNTQERSDSGVDVVSKIALDEGRELYVAHRQTESAFTEMGAIVLAPLGDRSLEVVEDTLADNEGDFYRTHRIHAMLTYAALKDNPYVKRNDSDAQLVAHLDPEDARRYAIYREVMGLEPVVSPMRTDVESEKTTMTASLRDAYGSTMWGFHDFNILPLPLTSDTERTWSDERTA
ncbi:MAG TPA: hypothetical protein VFH06_03715 [Candidatus Saccharimonadales bacterium]|nr:hypothetical protein [Candidatus Saccharimonadales bacterium]